MPSSSFLPSLIVTDPGDLPSQADPWCADATQLLGELPDHRHARGIRHDLGFLLSVLLAAACTTGFDGLIGAARWAATAGQDVLLALGARRDQRGRARCPSVRTLGRAAGGVAPEQLQEGVDAFTARVSVTRLPAPKLTRAGLRAVAIDGKAIRGARTAACPPPFLVALVTHATAACEPIVLTQQAVPDADRDSGESAETAATSKDSKDSKDSVVESAAAKKKRGEAPTGRMVIASLDLSGCVVTADAGHTYAATAAAIRAAGGHYLLVIKANQPKLLAHATSMLAGPDRDFPRCHTETDAGTLHARREYRHLRAVTVDADDLTAAGVRFPDAAQYARLTRRRRQVRAADRDQPGWDSKEVVYLVTSLPPELADAAMLLALSRGHWAVEAVHHVRDTSYAEDACRVTTASAAVNLAALRNLSITLIRLAGQKIKATLTWANADHAHAAALIQGRTQAMIT